MNGSRVYLRNYSQCNTLRGLIADVERTIGWLTALKSRTTDRIQLADIQQGIDAANSELDGLLSALAAAGCNEVPVNYTGHWIYVIYTGDNAVGQGINVYPLEATGDVPPSRTITGPKTGLTLPSGLALDSESNLFASDYASNAIMTYSPGADGNVLPVRVIVGSQTGLSNPTSLAMDTQDNLYVLNLAPSYAPSTVTVYAPGSSGNAQPVRTYQGIKLGLETIGDIAVDSDGNLYIPHANSYDAVTVFAPDGAVTRALTGLSVSAGFPGPGNASSVTVDAEGNLYVLEFSPVGDEAYVLVYPPGADGDAPATSAVLDTGLQNLTFSATVRTDRHGNIYVTSGYPRALGQPILPGAITMWFAGSSGNAAPSGTITGPLTGLSYPTALVIEDPHVQVPSVPPGRIGGG
jgi:hypothetical protein